MTDLQGIDRYKKARCLGWQRATYLLVEIVYQRFEGIFTHRHCRVYHHHQKERASRQVNKVDIFINSSLKSV